MPISAKPNYVSGDLLCVRQPAATCRMWVTLGHRCLTAERTSGSQKRAMAQIAAVPEAAPVGPLPAHNRPSVQISTRLCENADAARQHATLIRGGLAGRLKDSKWQATAHCRCSLLLRSRVSHGLQHFCCSRHATATADTHSPYVCQRLVPRSTPCRPVGPNTS
jgi:hypothetical protein